MSLGAKIGDANNIPLHDEPKFIRKIDPKSKSAIYQEFEEFEKWAVNSDIENACVITQNGEVYYCYGVKDFVFPNYDLGEKIRGAYISHNHVQGITEFSFSNADVEMFEQYELKVLRGVDWKYSYELSTSYTSFPKAPYDLTFETAQHSNIIILAEERGFGYRRELR